MYLPVNEYHLTLASGSPRRREFLTLGGWKFNVIPSSVDETNITNDSPDVHVIRLAASKARKVLDQIKNRSKQNVKRNGRETDINLSDGPYLILGADTIVVDGKDILGKPADEAEAVCMLEDLRSRIHQVYTGLALFSWDPRTSNSNSCHEPYTNFSLITNVCITDVVMRDYTDDEVTDYVASKDPMDKAGAYAIQNSVFQPVKSIRGCFTNVIGVPLCHIAQAFRDMGIEPPIETEEILQRCQRISGSQVLRPEFCHDIWRSQVEKSIQDLAINPGKTL